MNRFDCKIGKCSVVFSSFNSERAVLSSPPVYECLLVNVSTNANGDVSSVSLSNDISLLFNQERLDKLGSENVKKFLDSLAPRSSSLSELRSKISDSDLLKVCKSRYIQTASELLTWSSYLNDNYSVLVNKIQADNLSSPRSSSVSTSEPTPEPTTQS